MKKLYWLFCCLSLGLLVILPANSQTINANANHDAQQQEINDLFGLDASEANQDNDPFELVNRVILDMNLFVSRALIIPPAKIYNKALPEPVKESVGNFYKNLTAPRIVINDLLQAKFALAAKNTTRFAMNSTIGIGGLFDVAALYDYPYKNNNLDKTLGFYGVPDGPYIVLPFMPPANLRGALSEFADSRVEIDNYLFAKQAIYKYSLKSVNIVQATAQNYQLIESVLNDNADYYAIIRSANNQAKQGNRAKTTINFEE